MASLEVTSEIFKIESEIESVYYVLSDFSKLGRLFEMAKQMGGNMAEMQAVSEKVEGVRFSDDSCVITVKNIGDITIEMVEKEEPKLIKLATAGNLPLSMTLWVQLLESAPYDTRLKLTCHADVNMVLKMMLKGKLEKAINQVGEALAKVPYMMLKNLV